MQAALLYDLANELAGQTPGFFATKGPGAGNHATNAFIRELRERASREFGRDHSEQAVCGDNSLAVDFYFPTEGAVARQRLFQILNVVEQC